MKFIAMYKGIDFRVCGVVLLASVFALSLIFVSSSVVADVSVEGAEQVVPINDIRFPERKWGDKIKRVLDAGPMILSKDEVFDVASPPVNDSQITKDELTFLRELERDKRSDDTLVRIHFENDAGSAAEFFLKEGLLNPQDYRTVDFLRLTDEDHRYFILERKSNFARPRPTQLEKNLTTVFPNPGHPAYPSGHASQSYMVALILSGFDPENAERYKAFAIDVAHRREIAGVHYPSDSVAGRQLAIDVLARLRAVSVYEKKYQEAKASYIKPDFSVKSETENPEQVEK